MATLVPKRSLPIRPVAKETVLDQIYRQIRELILDGEIEPGQSVTIQSLADAFGVSAMPVREALHRLTAEKALTVIAGRSVGIAPLTLERLSDLRRVRLEVEGLAAEWAAPNVSAGDIERLDRLIAQMARGGDREGPQAFRAGQSGFPLHRLPRRGIGHAARDHRVALAADQSLFRSPARQGQLAHGQPLPPGDARRAGAR